MRAALFLAVPLALFALAGPASAQSAPKVGDAVWAEWKPNDWYKAKITKKTTKGFQVIYEDGVEGEVSASKVALDVAPDKGQVKDGVRVLAKWTDGKFYPGKAGAAKADGSYAVTFDDGDKANVKLKDLRLLAVAGAAPPDRELPVMSRTCMSKDPVKNPKGAFGLVGSDNFWTNLPVENGSQVLRVRFLVVGRDLKPGERALQAQVEKAAKIWSNHAAITFKFGNDPEAEIRIKFTDEYWSWSKLGTDATRTPKDEPTMELGLFHPNYAGEDQVRAITLHEFGHALGFEHEHQNPKGGIRWNTKKVLEDYTKQPEPGWTEKEVTEQIFNRVTTTKASEFDPKSIMLYEVKKEHTLDGYSTEWNKVLSKTDEEYAAKWYPPVAAKPTVKPTTKPTEPKGDPTWVIHVKITNESKSAVDVITLGTSTSKPQSLAPNASTTYTFEIDAVKGGGVEINGPKGGPQRYSLRSHAACTLNEVDGGVVVLQKVWLSPMAGDAVWAEGSKDGKWYQGKVVSNVDVASRGYPIKFDDGNTAVLAASKVAFDSVPGMSQVKEGTRVLAKWTDGNYYPGKVSAVKSGGNYDITYDDGDKGVAKLKDIRLIVK